MNQINQTTLASSGAEPATGKTRVELYTDGSSLGNPGASGYGVVALLRDEAGEVISKAERHGFSPWITTNNRAEMGAALAALAFIRDQSLPANGRSVP